MTRDSDPQLPTSGNDNRPLLQEELRQSTERFRTIFQHCTDAILILDPSHKAIIDVNDQACSLLGYTRSEYLTFRIETIFPRQIRRFKKFAKDVLEEGRGQSDEFSCTSKAGEILPARIIAWPIEIDDGRYLLTFIQDLERRVKAEEALWQSEHRFGTLIENMQEGVMIVDNNDVILFVNERTCEMLGYNEEDLIGKTGYKLLFNRKNQRIIREKNKLRTENIADKYEIEMQKKSREPLWVQISGVPITDSSGNVIGSFGIVTDISDRKAAEETLKRAHEELERRVEERTRELLESNKMLQQEVNERMEVEEKRKRAEEALQKSKDNLEIRVRERTVELSEANKDLKEQIQERQRAEEQLRDNERKYRLLFNSAHDAVFVHRPPDGESEETFVEVNDVAREILGYTRKELLKMSFRSISYQHDEAGTARRTAQLFDEKHLLYEDIFMTKTGSKIPVEISTHLFKFDDQWTVMSIARDITARLRAEEQIRDQAALLEKSQDAILVCDLNDYIIYWNMSAMRLYGWNTEEAIGNNAFELLFKTDSQQFISSRRTVLEAGEWQGELHQVTKEGREIIVESRWTLVHDNQDEPKSILVVNTDITEKKKIEAQFLRAQRMESIGALAGGIAHDLNNVLAPILTAVQILQVRIEEDKCHKILNTIESNVKRGADMVKQILTFARGVEGERIPLHPHHLINDLESIILETFPKSIKISLDVDQLLWTVSGDPTQLNQVLLNLCVNARDAMPEGGTLKISAENTYLDEKFVRSHLEAHIGKYVLIRVVDSGVGIPANIINRIFEPFFTTKDLHKGTGLGLSTVIAIVKSHGGFVNVSSQVGDGTSFDVYIPASEDIEIIEDATIDSSLPSGNGELILIIDDETSILEITRETLETYGYNVRIASDGAEAVGIYSKEHAQISVVVTDMMMPVMDGAATIRALRKIDPDVKIVASSGFMEDTKIEDFIGSGVEAFLHKPYTAEKLLYMVQDLLGKKQGGQSTNGNMQPGAES